MRPLLACSIAVVLVASACGSDGNPTAVVSQTVGTTQDGTPATGPTTTGKPGDPQIGTLEWESAGRGLQSATLTVPRDYRDPSKGTFELALVRRPASKPKERIGSLLVNRGGPGFGSIDLAQQAPQIYSDDILEHFDIVAWDPRGTGHSTPFIDCFDDYDLYIAGGDITPDDAAERQELVDTAKEVASECVERNPDVYQYVGTNNSARDMDSIRRALGEDTISYFGFSYGSELGATWATMFPDTVRAAVFDGAADPNADEVEGDLQQARGFEATLTTFLARCSDDSGCSFHNRGDAEGAFDALMAQLDERPIATTPGRPQLTRGMALTAVSNAMYDESYWPVLEKALAAAQKGDGSELLVLFDDYFQRRSDGTYDNSLEAFQVISCMDDDERLTVEQEDALVPRFQAAAPRFAAGTTGSYFCTFFPRSIDPRIPITGRNTPPIVVIGTTGDPATPIDSSRAMARAMERGHFIEVVADQHTGYNANRCVNEAIDAYLVDLEPPDDGLRCR